MEVAARMYAGKDLFQINQCRIRLQVTFLSDIASVDGKRILRAYHTGQGHIETGRRTRLNWPPIGQLPRKHWKLWMEFLERWCGTALHVETPLGRWFKEAEVLTCVSYLLNDGKLIRYTSEEDCCEFLPHGRSRTRFSIQAHALSADDIRLLDVCFRGDSIYVISQQAHTFVPTPQRPDIVTLRDLYRSLPATIQRVIGHVTWPTQDELMRIAASIEQGTVVGASDGSVRPTEGLSTHAWTIQDTTGAEIKGMGPVDGSQDVRTSHRAELQDQAAILTMVALFTHFYDIITGKITTFCDNSPVVTKMQRGWEMLRLRHTKGPDTDLQMLLKAAIDNLSPAVSYSTNWVKSHQDDHVDLRSLSREAALNVLMDRATKDAYLLPQEWQSNLFADVYPSEGCAVYINRSKVSSALRSTVLDKWHEQEALAYLQQRHNLNLTTIKYPHWKSLQCALKKLSYHRRSTAVKATHRHLPTQAKLFGQGRVTMCSLCPRCLADDETNEHVYCCQNDEATAQRKKDWYEMWKQLTKAQTATIISRTWRHFLLPLVGFSPSPFIEDCIPEAYGELADLLNTAIYEQSQIGWEKLLLGIGSTAWLSLQQRIDHDNPKAPQQSAEAWMNSAMHQCLKFSLRCWKQRNAHVHGVTRQEKQQQALKAAHEKITKVYSSPPTLDPQFRPIHEMPLAHRLRLPLHAAEQWLLLIEHQVKVTAHNLKILLRQHVQLECHFGSMEITAQQQAAIRRQSPSKDTPRQARHRAVQDTVRAMRAQLYAPKPRPQRRRRPNANHRPRRRHDGTITRHPSTRYHPP